MRNERTIATRQRSRRRCALWSTAGGIVHVCARSGTQRRLPWRLPGEERRRAAQSPSGTRVCASRAGRRPHRSSGRSGLVLYAQMAYSATRVARSSDPGRRRALALWWLQLGLNAAWTPVFFGARRTGAARGGHRRARARRRGYRGRERARRPIGPGCSTPRTLRGRPMRPRSTSRSGGGTAPRRPSRDRFVSTAMR